MTKENLDVQRVLSSLIRKEAKQGERSLSAICYIEKVLKETYSPERYGMKINAFETQRPLLIATLYKMIIARGGLPTVGEFVDHYIEESPKFSGERWLINAAYLSLVTDLHFYFVLAHSRLFDEVTIDYVFDLKAQTDIIVRKGNKLIGLQLFAGDSASKKGKSMQLSQSNKMLSYRLYLYSRQDRPELRKQLQTVNGDVISLYSERDAEYVMSLLEQQDEQASERFHMELFNEPSQHFFMPSKPNLKVPTKQVLTDAFHKLLQQAKHSILLFNDNSNEEIRKQMTQAAIERGIHLYFYDVPQQQLPKELQHVSSIIDGQHNGAYITPQQYDVLAKHFKEVSCNIFQYKVEHFNTQSDLIVTAGAGSGKTHTLISRTLFLLNTGVVERIQDIAMITFTNEAADNMRIKLADRFMELFKQTGDEKYRMYLEGLQEMQISTIPAFAKHILQRFGQFIGLGSDVSISNLTMQRRELIDEHLDKALQEANKPELFGELPYFEIVKFIEQVWEKVEQKGVALNDFRSQSNEDELFQIVLTLLNRAEESFKQQKIDRNTVTLADLTRLLNDLVQKSVPLSRLQQQYRYLFIDEFQDSATRC